MNRYKLVMLLMTIGIFFFSVQSFAYQVSFGDSVMYWPTWTGHSSYGYNDDGLDVIGNPNISGGHAMINNLGYLTSISFDYTVQNNDWGRLIPGNLFINLLNDNNDHVWDYVVNTLGANGANNLAAGNYGLYAITGLNIDDQKNGVNNGMYVLSGQDVTGIWSGYVIRDNHPIGIDGQYLTSQNKVGEVQYSGWPNQESGNPSAGHSIYDFTTYNNGKGLDLQGKDLTVGWETTCANDVVYEKVNNPVPEPTTLLLLGCGLLGMVGMKKTLTR